MPFRKLEPEYAIKRQLTSIVYSPSPSSRLLSPGNITCPAQTKHGRFRILSDALSYTAPLNTLSVEIEYRISFFKCNAEA